MNNIAIIPAKGNSKRIPGKNFKEFLGVPIIKYSIDAAKESGLFDAVFVSTDSEKIAEYSRAQGAWVPFLRDDALTKDDATMYDVIRGTLSELSKRNYNYENCCMIYATAPMIRAEDIKGGMEFMVQEVASVCIPVVRSPWHFQRTMVIEHGRLRMLYPGQGEMNSSAWFQDYHHAEHWWWISVPRFILNGTLFPHSAVGYILPEHSVCPIDTQEDWDYAEFKYMLWRGME